MRKIDVVHLIDTREVYMRLEEDCGISDDCFTLRTDAPFELYGRDIVRVGQALGLNIFPTEVLWCETWGDKVIENTADNVTLHIYAGAPEVIRMKDIRGKVLRNGLLKLCMTWQGGGSFESVYNGRFEVIWYGKSRAERASARLAADREAMAELKKRQASE